MMNDQRLVFSHHRYLFLTGATCPCLTLSSLVCVSIPGLRLTYMVIMADRSLSLHALMGLFLGSWESEDVKIFVDLFPLRWPSMMALRVL